MFVKRLGDQPRVIMLALKIKGAAIKQISLP
ncbi:unnamed protein product, partial [Allacma fusca]